MPHWLSLIIASIIVFVALYLALGLTLHAIDNRYTKISYRWVSQQLLRGMITLLISLVSIGAAVAGSLHWPKQTIGLLLIVLTTGLAVAEWRVCTGGFRNWRRLAGSMVMNIFFSVSLAGGLASISKYLGQDPITRGEFDKGAVISLLIIFWCRQFWQMYAYSTVPEYRDTQYYIVNPKGTLIGGVDESFFETAAEAGRFAIEHNNAPIDGKWGIAQVMPITKVPPKGWVKSLRDVSTTLRNTINSSSKKRLNSRTNPIEGDDIDQQGGAR